MPAEPETAQSSKEQADPEAQEKPQKEWEKRGEILQLVLGTGMVLWFQSIPLATMLGHALHNTGKWFRCDRGGHYELSTLSAGICGYTQGAACTFAPLCLMVMILFIGRELVQKRLYYGLLRQQNVVQFASNDPLTDPLAIAVLVSYVHVILYLIYIIYATSLFNSGMTGTFYQHVGVENSKTHGIEHVLIGDDYAFTMVVELVSFYVLPATLFIVFMYTGYDIEATLVPLSQYVHDAHDAGEGNRLSELQIIDDALCKKMVEDNAALILKGAGDHEQEFQECAKFYHGHMQAEDLQKVYMLDSLWPAMLLMPAEASGERPAQAFRILWWIYFGTSLVFGALVLWLLGFYISFSLQHLDIAHTLQLSVEVFISALCVVILWRLVSVSYKARFLQIREKDQ